MLKYHCHPQTQAVEGVHRLVRTASVSDAPALAALLKSVSAVWSVAQLEASICVYVSWQPLLHNFANNIDSNLVFASSWPRNNAGLDAATAYVDAACNYWRSSCWMCHSLAN